MSRPIFSMHLNVTVHFNIWFDANNMDFTETRPANDPNNRHNDPRPSTTSTARLYGGQGTSATLTQTNNPIAIPSTSATNSQFPRSAPLRRQPDHSSLRPSGNRSETNAQPATSGTARLNGGQGPSATRTQTYNVTTSLSTLATNSQVPSFVTSRLRPYNVGSTPSTSGNQPRTTAPSNSNITGNRDQGDRSSQDYRNDRHSGGRTRTIARRC